MAREIILKLRASKLEYSEAFLLGLRIKVERGVSIFNRL